ANGATRFWSRRDGTRSARTPGSEISCEGTGDEGRGKGSGCLMRPTRLGYWPTKSLSVGTPFPRPPSPVPVYENRHHVLPHVRRLGGRRNRAWPGARAPRPRDPLHLLCQPVPAARVRGPSDVPRGHTARVSPVRAIVT